jgi:hypothetical protein
MTDQDRAAAEAYARVWRCPIESDDIRDAFLEGIAHARAESAAEVSELREALERIHKLSLLGTNAISIEVSRMCTEALARRAKEGGDEN